MRPQDAMAAMKAFKSALNGSVVTAEEVSRREKICAGCPMRERRASLVTKVSKTLGILANVHRVPSSVSDFSCGVCGCSFMLLLPAKGKDLHVDSPEEAAKRPDFCWLTTADRSA